MATYTKPVVYSVMRIRGEIKGDTFNSVDTNKVQKNVKQQFPCYFQLFLFFGGGAGEFLLSWFLFSEARKLQTFKYRKFYLA